MSNTNLKLVVPALVELAVIQISSFNVLSAGGLVTIVIAILSNL
jgi:hypothetical protein